MSDPREPFAEGVEAWNPADMGGAGPAASFAALGPLTAAQIESLQKQAYDEAFRQGREEGLRAGLDEGRAQGISECGEQARQLQAVLASLSRPLEALDEEVETALVSLAAAIAQQVVRRELRTSPGEIVHAAREALGALPTAARDVSLHLHPQDVEIVTRALGNPGATGDWRLVEDATLTRGGCRVETRVSRVDATVERRLAAIIAQVFGGERDRDRDGDS